MPLLWTLQSELSRTFDRSDLHGVFALLGKIVVAAFIGAWIGLMVILVAKYLIWVWRIL